MRIIHYGDHKSQFVELYEPRSDASADTTVLIHGGYWRDAYGCDLMHALADKFRRRGSTVVNLEYRRIGEVPDPAWAAMSDDVLAGLDFARDLMPSVGATLTLVGHSAGGQLALWAASQRPVDTVIALAALADLAAADRDELSSNATRTLLGGTSAELPEVYAQASPIELPPLGCRQIVVHGNHDKNVPVEQSASYVRTAESAGDDVVGLIDARIDHFDVINPQHRIWTEVFGLL